LQLIGWDDKDGTGFGDLTGSEQSLSGEDAELSCEFARLAGGQHPPGPRLMIGNRNLAGQDRYEVVTMAALSEQHLPALSFADFSIWAQKLQLSIA
jgi:hypothetical protein